MNLIEFKKIVIESKSFSEVSRKMYGNNYYGNRQTIKKKIEEFSINISHFDFKSHGDCNRFNKIPLNEILISGSTYDTTNLKNRLFDEGLKERICEKCGQNEWWYDEKLSLILDHINGINNDHRIENLRILCPNCNGTLKTHGGKNLKLGRKKKPILIKGVSKKLLNVRESQRKVKRPPYEQLKREIEESGYCAVGRKYGVSDNTIRKWIKHYEKYSVA